MLQYRGCCGYSLVEHDRLLLPGKLSENICEHTNFNTPTMIMYLVYYHLIVYKLNPPASKNIDLVQLANFLIGMINKTSSFLYFRKSGYWHFTIQRETIRVQLASSRLWVCIGSGALHIARRWIREKISWTHSTVGTTSAIRHNLTLLPGEKKVSRYRNSSANMSVP